MPLQNPVSIGCFAQIPGTENKFAYLVQLLNGLFEGKTVTVGHVVASSAQTIPAGAWSYSLTVTGANAVVGGQAVSTGAVLSGVGPLAENLVLTTGAGTTIDFSYSTADSTNNNNPL